MKNLIKTIFLFLLYIPNCFALVLENNDDKTLEKLLGNKKVGYYVGSFDPIHKGHQSVVEHILENKICDFILIYPSWGQDSFKNRTSLPIRLKMLFALYKDNPKVIVTKLSPDKLQNKLMVPNHTLTKINNQIMMSSKFIHTKYYGILGSDVVLFWSKYNPNLKQKKFEEYMRGVEIPQKYSEHTLGGLMALSVEKFIVAIRDNDNLDIFNNILDSRPMQIIDAPNNNISSTYLKENITNPHIAKNIIDSNIYSIINNYQLYRD